METSSQDVEMTKQRSGPVTVLVQNGKPVTPQGEALLAADEFRGMFDW